jgi:glucosamine--fructose-6-phosphate aminotransferase (isomerizing)
MCGIVGYIGSTQAVDVLVTGLRRLEYRGYDSAGVATVNGHGLEVTKTLGKPANLEAAFTRNGRPRGTLGIAHTRWATHGRPSEANAHPHVDCHDRIAVVHNGIVENYQELRAALTVQGHRFRSTTDTEVIAHLIESYGDCDLPQAVSLAAKALRGSIAIACIAGDDPNVLVAFRGEGSPLVIGFGDGEAFLASDIPALIGMSREVVALDEGDMAILTRGQIAIQDVHGRPSRRSSTVISSNQEAVERNGYPHFMLKEIFEQPEAVRSTLAGRLDSRRGEVELPEVGLSDGELAAVKRVSFVACGTSWHAALIGKYLIEEFARIPADAEIASEFRHRRPVLDAHVLTVPVSQSGETADTLAASRQAGALGAPLVAICNSVGSSLAREANGVLHTRAGIEIGVAATKTFTGQLVAVTLLSLKLAQVRGTADRDVIAGMVRALDTVPTLMRAALEHNESILEIAARLADRKTVLYLGRGLHYPMALEGALKLKEISYIHAEGFPAGEMKHGPIALIEPGTPVVALAPCGPTLGSMGSSIQEVKARDGLVVAVVSEGDETVHGVADVRIAIPQAPYWIQPFLLAIPLQLLAYHLAALRGLDVDQPRNLAKSVTVE